MSLCSMIVSHDWPEVSVLECILGSLHIDVEVESKPELAWEKLAKSKVDALIVDCDHPENRGLIRRLNASDPDAGPVVIASGSGSRSGLESTGAKFVVEKPISVEHAVRVLSAARNHIVHQRLRYHRQSLNLPAVVSRTSGKTMRGRIINLSQTGVRIRTTKPLTLGERVHLKFKLAGVKRALSLDGTAAWSDEGGNTGIRLSRVSAALKRTLQIWVEQQYFKSAEAMQ